MLLICERKKVRKVWHIAHGIKSCWHANLIYRLKLYVLSGPVDKWMLISLPLKKRSKPQVPKSKWQGMIWKHVSQKSRQFLLCDFHFQLLLHHNFLLWMFLLHCSQKWIYIFLQIWRICVIYSVCVNYYSACITYYINISYENKIQVEN